MGKYYRYKGVRYKVLGTCQMKCPVTRNWVTAIMYQALLPDRADRKVDPDSPIFIREYNEFMEKFEK